MKKLLVSSGLFFTFMFSGCSMMPYHDTFECNKGVNTHICERVSDVYENSDNLNKGYKSNKISDNENDKFKKELLFLKRENRDLKNMVEAINYSLLQKPIEVIVINEAKEIKNKLKQTKTNSSEPKKINKYIKVCVANANIRVAPSCKAKIIRVVKKGTKLYALSVNRDGWIKLKDGDYIHRSVTNESCSN